MASGDFIADPDSVPKGTGPGDAYVLRNVLHDWHDAGVDKILASVRAAIGTSGATLVIGECAMPSRTSLSPIPAV